MPYPPKLHSETYVESMVQGFLMRELTRVYQVFTVKDGDGVIAATRDADLPQLGSDLIIPDGSGGERVWCVSRRPFRPKGLDSKSLWHVECRFTNRTDGFDRDQNGNPVDDPTDTVKRVTFDYDLITVPVEDATLVEIKVGGVSATVPPWLSNRTFTAGPVVNSAGIAQHAERQETRRRISVQRNVRNWDASWEDFAGSINSDSVTIQEQDADGIRATHTWEPNQLRMDVVRKINTWKDGKLYFAVRFEMTERKTTNGWLHVQPDVGTQQRVYPGVQKPRSSDSYDQQDVDDYGSFQSIVTEDSEGNKVAISEPQPLNGYGQPQPTLQLTSYTPDTPFELHFHKYPRQAFSGLPL